MRAAVIADRAQATPMIRDVAIPAIADDELLVQVATVGVNQLDLNVIAGTGPGARARLPRTLGIDPAGTVVAQGAAVDIDRVGHRVVVKPNISCGSCRFCAEGREADCPAQTVVGVHRDGGAAQFVAVPSRNAFPIGDLDFAVATAAVHSVPIALHLLNAGGGIRPGMTVLVTGASGAVGYAAVQLAAMGGARVLAAARSPLSPRSPMSPRDGVHAVQYTGADDLEQAVREVAASGVDLAVDATGSAAVLGAAVRALAWRGAAVFCAATGEASVTVDARSFYLQRKRLIGTASADYAEVAEAVALVRDGFVQPRLGARWRLDEAGDAYAAFAGRRTGGKQIIDIG